VGRPPANPRAFPAVCPTGVGSSRTRRSVSSAAARQSRRRIAEWRTVRRSSSDTPAVARAAAGCRRPCRVPDPAASRGRDDTAARSTVRRASAEPVAPAGSVPSPTSRPVVAPAETSEKASSVRRSIVRDPSSRPVVSDAGVWRRRPGPAIGSAGSTIPAGPATRCGVARPRSTPVVCPRAGAEWRRPGDVNGWAVARTSVRHVRTAAFPTPVRRSSTPGSTPVPGPPSRSVAIRSAGRAVCGPRGAG